MASTYVNDLRLNEMATGDASGSWGTATNTNLELIGEAMGYGTEAVADASTHTITMADGATDGFRCTFLRLTGGGQACTVTLAPNTLSHTWIIRNTTGYALTFTQGSGANVIIAAGLAKMVTTDGLGSGAVVYECLEALELGGTLTVGIDDTGHDVKFFGATSGAYMLWDESADDLLLVGAAGLNVAGSTVLASVDVTAVATAATFEPDGDTAAADNAAIGYTAAEGLILTGQGSTDDITVKNDADTTVLNVATGATDVEVSAGNLLFGTGSKGVYLGVTSATAANLLDDYEEGTFTATLTGTGATGSSVTRTGNYTKIGRDVHLDIYFVNSNTTGFSGSIQVTGLPFAANTVNVGSCGLYNIALVSIGAFSYIGAGYSYLEVYCNRDASTWLAAAHSAGTGRYMLLDITYGV